VNPHGRLIPADLSLLTPLLNERSGDEDELPVLVPSIMARSPASIRQRETRSMSGGSGLLAEAEEAASWSRCHGEADDGQLGEKIRVSSAGGMSRWWRRR